MVTPDDEPTFLRDLIKASRQRPIQVRWTDRDGTARQTALTSAEASRLNTLAHREGISSGEVLRRAAHIPVAKQAATGGPEAKPRSASQTGEQSGQVS